MKFFQTPEIQVGGPFKCFMCGSTLALELTGSEFKVKLFCKRCKTFYLIKTRLPLKFIQEIKEKQQKEEDKSKENMEFAEAQPSCGVMGD